MDQAQFFPPAFPSRLRTDRLTGHRQAEGHVVGPFILKHSAFLLELAEQKRLVTGTEVTWINRFEEPRVLCGPGDLEEARFGGNVGVNGTIAKGLKPHTESGAFSRTGEADFHLPKKLFINVHAEKLIGAMLTGPVVEYLNRYRSSGRVINCCYIDEVFLAFSSTFRR